MFDSMLRGALSVLSPAGVGAKLSIAIFHRVHAQPDPLFPDEPDRRRFDELCRWLKTWFQVLPLDEAVLALQEGRLPSRALCITFDDGYADNHDHALPVLREHGLTATFFIATGFIDGGRMWNDTIVEAVRRCERPALDLGDVLPGQTAPLDLSSPLARGRAIRTVLGSTKYLPQAERQAVADRIALRAGATLPTDLMMSSSQVRAMAAAGMQVGAHTVSHPILATLDDEECRSEMLRSKAHLEALLAQPVNLFAYPNGRPGRDYLPRDVALAREAGFSAAVSTSPGATRAGQDVFQLRRFTPWDKGALAFGSRMARNLLPTGMGR